MRLNRNRTSSAMIAGLSTCVVAGAFAQSQTPPAQTPDTWEALGRFAMWAAISALAVALADWRRRRQAADSKADLRDLVDRLETELLEEKAENQGFLNRIRVLESLYRCYREAYGKVIAGLRARASGGELPGWVSKPEMSETIEGLDRSEMLELKRLAATARK